jgi:hypothetical protein
MMDDRERIQRLEARIDDLETELKVLQRALAARAPGAPAPSPTERSEGAGRPTPTPPPVESRERRSEERKGAPVVKVMPARTGIRASLPPAFRRDLETWFGEHALLVVGVLALVAATAFALKYAFDQGWISPEVRVLAGLALGLGIAVYGELMRRRGLPTYGAAAQGAGAAIAYAAVWAAAGPYQFVPAAVGIGALAVLSVLLFVSAARSDEEYLAGLAAIGAYLAPVLLGDPAGPANMVLAYGVLVSAAAGAIAAARRWRVAMAIVLVGYFVLFAVARWGGADDALSAVYLVVGGTCALVTTRGLGWVEHEAGSWLLAWGGLVVLAALVEGWRGWVLAASPVALVAPYWLEVMEARRALGERAEDTAVALQRERLILFALSAVAWAWIAFLALPESAGPYRGAVLGAIGLLFLVPGLALRSPELHVTAVGILAAAIAVQWDGLEVIAGWAVLIVVVALTTRAAPLAAGRWTTAALGAFAAFFLFGVEIPARSEADPALVGHWPLVVYAVIASLVLVAGPPWKETRERWAKPGGIDLRAAIWVLAGFVLLVGGSVEIPRFLEQRGTADLAAGLAVSAFWLLYAGALLAYGFITDRRPVRVGGLAVAALAILKVVFYDLQTLQALYRVGSLALLAVLALAAARAYHRRAQDRSVDEVPDD